MAPPGPAAPGAPPGSVARFRSRRSCRPDHPHHCELVASQPGCRIRRSQTALQPLGDHDQQLVADLVAKAVVDDLEVIEVQEHHGHRFVSSARPYQRMLEPVKKERAIRQARERVVESLMLESIAQCCSLGDIAELSTMPPTLASSIRLFAISSRKRQLPSLWRMRTSIPEAALPASAASLRKR